ncbi:uncharacterized protein LOC122059213 [Macadamia integrifolia]|uniref:uncharacterized protein LOC122059213 n=1 Tax=Macadamia integrifolia TaxID=60698 RepID=UPI001C52BE39|nr:uncharacterized protein LOC122059213 [Macadamia integrifolia]
METACRFERMVHARIKTEAETKRIRGKPLKVRGQLKVASKNARVEEEKADATERRVEVLVAQMALQLQDLVKAKETLQAKVTETQESLKKLKEEHAARVRAMEDKHRAELKVALKNMVEGYVVTLEGEAWLIDLNTTSFNLGSDTTANFALCKCPSLNFFDNKHYIAPPPESSVLPTSPDEHGAVEVAVPRKSDE